jgi:hypothetical protein
MHQFKVEFNDTSRAYFEKYGVIEGGQKGADMIAAAKRDDAAAIERLKKDPTSNSILRTNCVATQHSDIRRFGNAHRRRTQQPSRAQ